VFTRVGAKTSMPTRSSLTRANCVVAASKHQSPNPRLQRTPLRAPLSRKPLGASVLTAHKGRHGAQIEEIRS
jgi:hypothetical protein